MRKTTTPGVSASSPTSDNAPTLTSSPTNPVSMYVANITEIMGKDIADTMVEIQTPTKFPTTSDFRQDIKQFTVSKISDQIHLRHTNENTARNLYVDENRQANAFIERFEDEYKDGADKLCSHMSWINANMDSYEKKFNHCFKENLDALLKEARISFASKTDQLSQQLEEIKFTIESKVMVINHDRLKFADIVVKSHFIT